LARRKEGLGKLISNSQGSRFPSKISLGVWLLNFIQALVLHFEVYLIRASKGSLLPFLENFPQLTNLSLHKRGKERKVYPLISQAFFRSRYS